MPEQANACQCLCVISLDFFQVLLVNCAKLRYRRDLTMRGTKVIVRCFGGVASVLRVWEAANGLIYLSTDAEFEKLQAGRDALPPIGFPAGDVFVYEGDALKQNGRVNWQRLKQWKPYKVVTAGER
jgi:hypothetical protein